GDKSRFCAKLKKAMQGEIFYSTLEEEECMGGARYSGLKDMAEYPANVQSGAFNVVVGTTGLSCEQLDEIKEAVEKNKIKAVISPNMAIGVNVFFKVIEDLAKILNDYDIEIIEAHHQHKADAPSGTALKAYEIMAEALGRDKDDTFVPGRQGMVGERTPGEIGIHAVRGGDIIGDHTVLFAGDGELIEIIHRAHSRQSFVTGAMKAVRYLDRAPAGRVCDMSDVLEIK
ncbi:MAG: 4-hydroxy-tetrahydrodipicolinate reductase, partial [Methanobacteriaceae archaeon]|nr:4-hydroxy-tetrahydrodipicolinate reductase [Methanobacteriaceae archaeon]